MYFWGIFSSFHALHVSYSRMKVIKEAFIIIFLWNFLKWIAPICYRILEYWCLRFFFKNHQSYKLGVLCIFFRICRTKKVDWKRIVFATVDYKKKLIKNMTHKNRCFNIILDFLEYFSRASELLTHGPSELITCIFLIFFCRIIRHIYRPGFWKYIFNDQVIKLDN